MRQLKTEVVVTVERRRGRKEIEHRAITNRILGSDVPVESGIQWIGL